MVLFAIASVILLALVIFSVIYFNRIKPVCPNINAAYGIKPNTTGIPLYLCGNDSKQKCIFNATSVASAIDLCNSYLKICQQFTYTPGTPGIVTFIQSDGIISSQSSDTYIYQLGTIN